MKKTKIKHLATLFFVAILAIGYTGCTKQKTGTHNNVEHCEGCSEEESVQLNNVELSFILEQSGSAGSNLTLFDSTDNIMKTIDAAIKLNTEGLTSKGCKVRITTIGTSIRPKVYTLVLSPGKSWMETNDKTRKQAVHRFRKQVLAVLQHILNTPAKEQRSQVYLSMCQELNALSSSTFGKTKALYILSDGIQSDGDIEFIKYAKTLEKFKQAFPEFKKQMVAQCPLPDLSNIDIFMTNSPKHELGAFILTCDQYWRELILEHNGKLTVKGSLDS